MAPSPDRNLREEDLLLALVGLTIGARSRADVQPFFAGPPIDWTLLLQFAEAHRVRPPLYAALNEYFKAATPPDVLARLRAYYVFNLSRNMMLSQETLRISKTLADEGITSIVYKGPLQASMIYRNMALREIADIDTIVHPDNLTSAKNALLAEDYNIAPTEEPMTDEELLAHPNKYALGLIRRDGPVSLEIHWRVMPAHSWYTYTTERLWDFVRPETIGETKVNFLQREFIFVQLCNHNEKHNWRGIRYLADVAGMIQTQRDINWKLVVQMASSFGKTNALLITCNLCRHLLGVELPEPIAEELRGAGLVRARCAAIRANLFSTDVISFPSYRRWRFHCRQLDGDTDCSSWSDPFAYLASVLWPEASDKRRWFPLPPRLHFIYILPRLLRYLKWNYITSSPARNKPNSEART